MSLLNVRGLFAGMLIAVVNPISRPTVGDILIAGGSFDILVPFLSRYHQY
jgi:hypothetical protein